MKASANRTTTISRRALVGSGLACLALLPHELRSGAGAAPAPEMVSVAASSGYANPDLLAEPDWLMERLTAGTVKLVALTPPADFEAGHIPGAAQINWSDLDVTDTSDPFIERWQGLVELKLTALGITPDSSVVIYDGGTLIAPRLWWILRQLGHTDARILNGGLAAWQAAGGKIEEGVSTANPATELYLGTPDPALLATMDEVVAALDDPTVVLIDGRRPDEFSQGHIPGAVLIPFTDNAVAEEPKVWKSAEVLRGMYEPVGATSDKQIVTYCATGVRSSNTYFTLALLGYEHLSVYIGSWKEWGSHPELPMETG